MQVVDLQVLEVKVVDAGGSELLNLFLTIAKQRIGLKHVLQSAKYYIIR